MPPVINKKKCISCYHCVDICPLDVFGRQEKSDRPPMVKYPEECWHCNACVIECPAKALRIRLPVQDMVVFIDAPDVKN
ncbi:MAG: ferredoxin family protein [Oscillospiraceae bacterium]